MSLNSKRPTPNTTLVSSNQGRGQRLPAGIASVELVPELDLGLAEPPAKQNLATVHLAGEIDEAKSPVLELNAQLLELVLKAVDLAGEHLSLPLELLGSVARLTGARARRYKIELENLLTPESMLANDILDDLANEWQSAIRPFDSEQRHVREVSVWTPYSGD
jgi:hypothetical protein